MTQAKKGYLKRIEKFKIGMNSQYKRVKNHRNREKGDEIRTRASC